MGTELRDTKPKMNKGVSMMLKNLLGIEPEELFAHFAETIQMMKDFCAHFDRRMVLVAKETADLRAEIARLAAVIEKRDQSMSEESTTHANGYDREPELSEPSNLGRSDQIA